MGKRTAALAGSLGLLTVLLWGCVPPSGGGSSRCEAGEVRSCACPNGIEGQRTCDDDLRFGVCECPEGNTDATMGTATDGGASQQDATGVNDMRVNGDMGGPNNGADTGITDAGRPPRDQGVAVEADASAFFDASVSPEPERDASVPPRPDDAGGFPLRDFDVARDVGIDLDFGGEPDPLEPPQCRDEVPSCEATCAWVGACFSDRDVCPGGGREDGRQMAQFCQDFCRPFGLNRRVCDVEQCDQMNRLDALFGQQWDNLCREENLDAAPPVGPGPIDGGPMPMPRDGGVADPSHPGDNGPNCGGGCEPPLCDWVASCFTFHPALCPAGSRDLARQAGEQCVDMCFGNPGVAIVACDFQSCRELSQVAGILNMDIELACNEEGPDNPDPGCGDGVFVDGLCWHDLSLACHRGRATTYCAEAGGRLPDERELRQLFDSGWDPGNDYHTIAMRVDRGGECNDGVANIVMPTWRQDGAYDVWQCGDDPGFCSRAVICVR